MCAFGVLAVSVCVEWLFFGGVFVCWCCVASFDSPMYCLLFLCVIVLFVFWGCMVLCVVMSLRVCCFVVIACVCFVCSLCFCVFCV